MSSQSSSESLTSKEEKDLEIQSIIPKNQKTNLKPFQEQGIQRIQELHNKYKGGLILSATGTGKSIQILSHLFHQLEKNPKETNLIICPPHLIENWKKEIQTHFDFSDKNINIFHGPNRTYQKESITITSYGLVKTLPVNRYSRIILDEAHFIRNKRTQTYKNVISLESDYKWVLTATPVFNDIQELKSYFNFLKFEYGNITPYYLKKYSLKQDKKLLNLPEKKETIVELEISEEEKNYHYEIIERSKQRIVNLRQMIENAENNRMRKFLNMNLFTIILRLRQACNFVEIETKKKIQTEENSEPEIEIEQCPICYDNEANCTSSCGHDICFTCWDKILRISNSCPMCRKLVTKESLTMKKNKKAVYDIKTLSSKLEALTKIIQEKEGKIIISSQWLSSLSLIEKRLKSLNISFLRVDGSIVNKNSIIEEFKSKKEYKILLVSLHCCSEGLTITEANTVIHFDFWWNPQKTHQLSSRIYRIGQEKTVEVIYLRTKDTIEFMMKKINTIKKKLDIKVLETEDEEIDYSEYNTKGIISKIMSFNKHERFLEDELTEEEV